MPIKVARGSFRRAEVIVGTLISAKVSSRDAPNDLMVWLQRNVYRALGYCYALISASQEGIPEEYRMDLGEARERHDMYSMALQLSWERR